jgi:hypothetical protein
MAKVPVPKKLADLCTPARVYFILAFVSLFLIATQNIGNKKQYCIGRVKCNVPNTMAVFLVKILYALFWTWILHLICKSGYKDVAWFLVLFPFVFMLVLLIVTII